MLPYLYLLSIAILPFAACLVAYDCGGTGLNVTTVSLLDVGECNIEPRNINESSVYIQLLQLSNFDHVQVTHCKIEVTRIIYHCGMHSHASVVHNGHNEYLFDISNQGCKRLHEDGSISLGSHLYLTGFKVNETSTRPVTFAGSISASGSCSGTIYSDPYGTWENVVVQGTVRVTLKTSMARIKLASGTIMLYSGTTCRLQNGHCIDDDSGHSFWVPTPTSSCNFKQYDTLYEGYSAKIFDVHDTVSPTVYTLTTQDVTFALAIIGETPLCGYTLLRTEHPKLFILETAPGRSIAAKKTIAVDNLDIFTYVNSKFIYVERHLRVQLNNLYYDVLQQRCRLERQVIKNALALAKTSPEEFAYTLMKGPGYVSVIAGEVAHLLRCVPVNVRIRHESACFNELPVTKGNVSLFVTPKTRTLIKIGTQRDCNNFLPVMYNIDGTWHRFSPYPLESLDPQKLQPLTTPSWKYLTPISLATSGIYSEGDLERLRDFIMFPAEKAAVLNTIARGAQGQPVVQSGLSMYNLLDEDSLNKITESAASKMWKGFLSFGSVSAGILAVFVIIRFVKLFFDTLIRGYALHSVYGWSIHLLGAIWSSIASLLMHLAPRQRSETTNESAVVIKEDAPTVNPSEGVSSRPPVLPRAHPVTVPDIKIQSYEELRDRISRIDRNRAIH